MVKYTLGHNIYTFNMEPNVYSADFSH